MAISTDILADVVAASDPRRAEAARRRLESLSVADGSGFSQLVTAQQAPPARHPIEKPASAPPRENRISKPLAVGNTPTSMAYRALGGVLLQKTFETMLPDLGGLGGRTSGAAMWKSMLAQKLADSVSPSVFRQQRFSAQGGGDGVAVAARSDGPRPVLES